MTKQGARFRMSNSITFLHAADLHLDSPFKGISDVPEQVFQTMRESTFKAFNELIQTAIEKQVNFVLLVGDLFDEKKQSLKAQLHLREGFLRLQENEIDVFLSYGNHDYIKGNEYPITYPDNVHVFPDENVTTIPYKEKGKNLANIYGFSYVNRDVRENKAEQFTIDKNQIGYHIAMLHGSLHGNQEHNPYAPFRLEDLQGEAFDYWALGHIHKRNVIQTEPPVIYPGNIQGRHRKESGPKGCYYVKMDSTGAELQFIPLQHVTILDYEIDIRNYETIAQIKTALIKKLKENQSELELIHLTFISDEEQAEVLGLHKRLDELVDIINETLLNETYWKYIYDCKINIVDEGRINVDSFFMKEIKEAVKNIDYEEIIDDLYSHPQAKKQLQISDEEKIIEQAIEYVTEEMSKKVR